MKRIIKLSIFSALLIIVLAGCSIGSMDHSDMDHSDKGHSNMDQVNRGEQSTPEKNPVSMVEIDGKKVFQIEATETHWMYNDELMDTAWTYNGMLPGQEIRVTEGDHVVINLVNSLSVPTAIHFHGIPVPNEMDGVPGVTQNAVLPGEEFTYEFIADTPGTYWYHSHQKGSEQVGKGLYGAFIIEPKDKQEVDHDQVIMISEWSSMGMDMGDMDHGSMGMDDMDHGNNDHGNNDHGNNDHGNNDHGMSHSDMMNQMYDTMLINGRAAPAIESIVVEQGDTVKLRFVNAGLFTQVVTIPEHSFKVTHFDGQEVNDPQLLQDMAIRIAPAERYDVEIKMDQPGAWGIQVFAEQNKEKLSALIPVVYAGEESAELQTVTSLNDYFDMTTYGQAIDLQFGEITKEYDMILGTNDGGETFTINNKQMPDHHVYEVDEGDVVKVTITNETDVDHPMHLHGQFFYVVSRNGEPVSGSSIVKDTLNVRPNEAYEVVFIADNPGHWLFHCHELHHAAGGMVSEVKYSGFKPSFTPDPSIDNQPE